MHTKELIVKNGILVTQNKKHDIFQHGLIHICHGKIIFVGNEEGYCIPEDARLIDAQGGIIMPGFINTHTHIGMTLFRTLADDRADRLRKVLIPLEMKYVTPELVFLASQHCLVEMIQGGTTTLADMYYFEEKTALACEQAGIRAILAETAMHASTPDCRSVSETLQRTDILLEQFSDSESDLITIGIAPHAPYTLEKQELCNIAECADKRNIPVMSHLAEMNYETTYVHERFGMSPVEYYDECGLLNDRFLAAHCLLASHSDLDLLAERGCGIAHNMVANIKSGKGVAPVPQMLERGMRVGLGTDGPMSGNTMDMIHQLGYVSKLQKAMHKDPLIMPPQTVVDMATIGGAQALHMEKKIGSLEAGKRADIIIISTDAPSMYPIYDVYSALVYCASPRDVQTVLVDGRILMENRHLKTLDAPEIREKCTKYIDIIQADFGKDAPA
ncbi:amidohydrolase [candidate division KSB3 bacterium]|uniref:Amidohydrolase n=1 Tax=candidate division KSB3 bacterium TaxID=2044937 RepID=A0A2G6KDM9_9BACT|nr:MAG: amidohydrolase [candidate division KSB3 bacterium]